MPYIQFKNLLSGDIFTIIYMIKYILYDKPGNENCQNKTEKVQFKACLAMTGATQGTWRKKLYEVLGFHWLVGRRLHSKLIFVYKIVNDLLSDYHYAYLNFIS